MNDMAPRKSAWPDGEVGDVKTILTLRVEASTQHAVGQESIIKVTSGSSRRDTFSMRNQNEALEVC